VSTAPDLHQTISRLVHEDRGRLLSALIASLGNFDLAEEALADALESAVIHWARSGIPQNPQGWLLQVARRKAIDRIRRNKQFRAFQPELTRLAQEDEMHANRTSPDIPDNRLALIFTCCHPALEEKSRIALTLRTLGGLTTAEIARAYLDKEATMGQRLSRAKSKIVTSKIPYEVPGPELWAERLASVLSVIYLIFNEGYVASSGDVAIRTELCEEAIYLARLLNNLRAVEPEIMGLLSLMLTTHARRIARQSANSMTISLADQDRKLWDQALIDEGVELLDVALIQPRPGPFQIKAAISALHSSARTASATDWQQIRLLYDSLLEFEPTPVVRLNRAVARAETGDLAGALADIDKLQGELGTYQPLHAARAEYLARDRQNAAAHVAYEQAIRLTGNAADRKFLLHQQTKLRH